MDKIIRMSYSEFDKLEFVRQNVYRDKKNRLLEVLEILEDYKIVKMKVV